MNRKSSKAEDLCLLVGRARDLLGHAPSFAIKTLWFQVRKTLQTLLLELENSFPGIKLLPWFLPQCYGGLGLSFDDRVMHVLEQEGIPCRPSENDIRVANFIRDKHIAGFHDLKPSDSWQTWKVMQNRVPEKFWTTSEDPKEIEDSQLLTKALMFVTLARVPVDELFQGLKKDDQIESEFRDVLRNNLKSYLRRVPRRIRNGDIPYPCSMSDPWASKPKNVLKVRVIDVEREWEDAL